MYIMYTNTNGLLIPIGCSLLSMMMHVYTYYLLCKENTHWTLSLLYNVIDVQSAVVEYR